MIARSVAKGVGLEMREAAEDVHVVPHRGQGVENRRQIEVGAYRGRNPLVLDHTIGDVDETQTRRWPAGSGKRRNHGIEQWQRQRCAGASQEGSTGQGLFGDEHHAAPCSW